MFSTITGVKQSFYSQTGNFQFGMNLIVPTLFGGINVGVSGANPTGNKINFLCNSGKIFDNSGRFLQVYKAGEKFSLSGNVSSQSYDFFVNGSPESYNNYKNTGSFNYLFLENPGGLSCDYDFFVNGEQPSLSINPVVCFTGDYAGTGYIVNQKPQFPVRIYSGNFLNLSDNLPLFVSGIFTGDLTNSGKFYVIPTNSGIGFYTGHLQLITNGGTFNLDTTITITGSPALPNYSFNLIDSLNTTVTAGNSKFYVSNISCPSGSGIPMVFFLDSVSGTGNFYTDILVSTGKIASISGYIFESGALSGYYLGTGTGIGGQISSTGTGFADGILTGFQWATGLNFTWPWTLVISGWGSGNNYSGIGTGNYNSTVTGTILGGSGRFFYDGFFTGNATPIFSISGTGNLDLGLGTGSQIVTIGAITGYIQQYFSGSGTYTGIGTGTLTGNGITVDYQKTFLSSWNFFTGNGLGQVDYLAAGFYNAGQNRYTNNTPKWYINSSTSIKISYENLHDSNLDVCRLTVSGLNFQTGLELFLTGSSS